MRASLSFDVGILVRRSVRNLLEEVQFNHPDFRFLETKGFLESTFHIKGELDLVQSVRLSLEKHFEAN